MKFECTRRTQIQYYLVINNQSDVSVCIVYPRAPRERLMFGVTDRMVAAKFDYCLYDFTLLLLGREVLCRVARRGVI